MGVADSIHFSIAPPPVFAKVRNTMPIPGRNEESVTLPQYISSRREYDEMPVHKVRESLIQRGKIAEAVTQQAVWDACIAAKRLFDVYLR